jgi:hypothetical protein
MTTDSAQKTPKAVGAAGPGRQVFCLPYAK